MSQKDETVVNTGLTGKGVALPAVIALVVAALAGGAAGGYFLSPAPAAPVEQAIQFDDEEPAAEVNGEVITFGDLQESLLQEAGAATLDRMITNEVIRQATESEGIEIPPSAVDAEMDGIRANFENEEQFQMVLEQNGITIAELEEDIRISLILEQVVGGDITVSDEEIEMFYEQNQAQLQGGLEENRVTIEEMIRQQQLEAVSQGWIQEQIAAADVRNHFQDQ